MCSGFDGLGDNIYQRPFVKDIVQTLKTDVYLKTPWPEIYADIPGLMFVNPNTVYRTQQRNIRRLDPKIWKVPPRITRRETVRFAYGQAEFLNGDTIFQVYERSWKLNSFTFNLPDYSSTVRDILDKAQGRKIAFIRPATVRSEWHVETRNARADYIAWCAKRLLELGYYVISLADLKQNAEWLVEPAPPCHESFYRGELAVNRLLGLMQNSAIVVGGVGFILPAAIAAPVPLFCILGGRGAYDNPRNLTDPRMDLSKTYFAKPDNFCECDQARHNCDKSISTLTQQFEAFLATLNK